MLAEVWQPAAGWGGWPFLGFIIPVLVAIVAAALPYWHSQLISQLADPTDRASIRAELMTDAPAGRRFRDGIDKLLGGVDRYFGPAHRWRAYRLGGGGAGRARNNRAARGPDGMGTGLARHSARAFDRRRVRLGLVRLFESEPNRRGNTPLA